MISEYSKTIQLEKPSNADAKYFVNVMGTVSNRIKENFQTLQSFTDELAGVDIIRADDKEYYDNKVKDVTNRLNEMGAVNFNNLGSVMQAKRALGEMTTDKRVMNAVTQTKYVRRIMDQWEKVQTNPKLAKSWNPINYDYDMTTINNYLNNPDSMVSLGIQNASLYGGENEQLYQLGEKMKESSRDYTSGISKLTKKGKDENALYGQMDSIPSMARQNRIEYEYYRKNNPNFAAEMVKGLPDEINRIKQEIAALEIIEKGSVNSIGPDGKVITGAGYSGKAADEARIYQTRLRNLEAIKGMPQEEAAFALYQEHKRARHVQTFHNPSVTYGENKAAATYLQLQALSKNLELKAKQSELDATKFEWQTQIDRASNALGWAELGSRERIAEMNANASITRAGISASGRRNSSGSIAGDPLGIDPNLYLTDAPLVEEPNMSFLENKKKQSEGYSAAFTNRLEALTELLNSNSASDQQFKSTFVEKLKQQGLNVSEANLNKVFTLDNINKITAALDLVESNTGENQLSSYGIEIADIVNQMSDIKQKKYIADLQLQVAYKGTENLSEKEREKMAEARLQTMGDLRVHGKVVDLSVTNKDLDPRLDVFENAVKGKVLNTPYFTVTEKGKKINYYTDPTNPITGKKGEESKLLNIDKSKTVARQLDVQNKKLYVDVAIKGETASDTQYRRMEVPLNDADIDRFAKLLNPNIGYYTGKGLELEEILLNGNLDNTIVSKFATEKFNMNSRALGLPPGTTLSYSMAPLKKNNKIAFTIHTSQGSFNTHKFRSRQELFSTFSYAYKESKAAYKAAEPNLTEEQLHLKALQATLKEIQR